MLKPQVSRSPAPVHVLVFAALLALGSIQTGWAQTVNSGEQVYKEVCAACHDAGVAKAPKLGDRKAWAPLIKEGQSMITIDGWFGERGMPPKGGKADLGLEEFARAVAHMGRAAGAKWKDPDAAMLTRLKAAEKKRLDKLKPRK